MGHLRHRLPVHRPRLRPPGARHAGRGRALRLLPARLRQRRCLLHHVVLLGVDLGHQCRIGDRHRGLPGNAGAGAVRAPGPAAAGGHGHHLVLRAGQPARCAGFGPGATGVGGAQAAADERHRAAGRVDLGNRQRRLRGAPAAHAIHAGRHRRSRHHCPVRNAGRGMRLAACDQGARAGAHHPARHDCRHAGRGSSVCAGLHDSHALAAAGRAGRLQRPLRRPVPPLLGWRQRALAGDGRHLQRPGGAEWLDHAGGRSDRVDGSPRHFPRHVESAQPPRRASLVAAAGGSAGQRDDRNELQPLDGRGLHFPDAGGHGSQHAALPGRRRGGIQAAPARRIGARGSAVPECGDELRFSLWAFYGMGREAFWWGMALGAVSLPVFWLVRWRQKAQQAAGNTPPAAAPQ